MKQNFSLIKNKKASVTLITLFAIMCVLFPMLAIIYDIGMIHIYKQDLKNIQEVAGTTCVPDAKGRTELPKSCIKLAEAYVFANLGQRTGFSSNKFPDKIRSQIGALRNTQNGIPLCSDSGAKTTRLCKISGRQYVTVGPDPNNSRSMIVHIQGIAYKPMFLTKTLLNFGKTKKSKEPDDFYELKIPESKFSPTYQQ